MTDGWGYWRVITYFFQKAPAKPKKTKEPKEDKPEEKKEEVPAENGEAKVDDVGTRYCTWYCIFFFKKTVD